MDRRARADDAEAIADVHVRSWRSPYAGMLPDEVIEQMAAGRDVRVEHFRGWHGEMDGIRHGWVAVENGAVIGMAVTVPSRDPDAGPSTGEPAADRRAAAQVREVGRRRAERTDAADAIGQQRPVVAFIVRLHRRSTLRKAVDGARRPQPAHHGRLRSPAASCGRNAPVRVGYGARAGRLRPPRVARAARRGGGRWRPQSASSGWLSRPAGTSGHRSHSG